MSKHSTNKTFLIKALAFLGISISVTAVIIFCFFEYVKKSSGYYEKEPEPVKAEAVQKEKVPPTEAPPEEPEPLPEKFVALTFDDGPGQYTSDFLNALNERDAKVTFFVLGQEVVKYPNTTKQILDDGHEIGLHTYGHKTLTELSNQDINEQLHATINAVKEVSGLEPSKLMRPPGGKYNSDVLDVCKDNGMSLILWSVDTKDWQSRNADTVVDVTRQTVNDGSIVLFHDIYDTSINAALRLIDELGAEGYKFLTVTELLERGGEIAPGEVYKGS